MAYDIGIEIHVIAQVLMPSLIMRSYFCSLLSFFIASIAVSQAQEKSKPTENDLIYPPVEAAKPFIDFDGAGFTINGQRTYYSSGSIHYPRVPHELWYDRLLRLKRANFAAVQTYTFWNFHEPKEGQFDFTGYKDFEGFLNTAQQLGLYATVRVGPYVCAEWDSGGYPVWLKFEPHFMVRTNDVEWLSLNDHWYKKILPIVARHQINHGGNVVMVQLENEHPRGWGVIKDDPYFVHLSDEAVKLGIEVPYFMSGQHHGAAPTPGNLDSGTRSNPWITTEFWAGWYNVYGSLAEDRNLAIETANWTILAHGGGGHNFYMLHGGTDFETWNNNEVAASYDDGAAIGQAGDLRPVYYLMKRANQLAESFPEILANGNDVLTDYRDYATGPGVNILGARKSNSGAGTFVFIQNSTTNETMAIFKSGEQLKLAPNGIYPLPNDVALTDHAKIVDSTLPVLALAHNGQAVTIVVYGQSGETGRLALSASDGIQMHSADSDNFVTALADANDLNLKITIPTNGVAEFKLSEPQHSIRVLALNRDLSLYTWILGSANRQYIIVGPEFIQDVDETNGNISVTIERPYGQPSCGQVAVYGGTDQSWHLDAKADLSQDNDPAPKLMNWQMSSMTEASPSFDDSQWKHSQIPLQMGADGDTSAFAWYRASLNLPFATNGILQLHGNDDLEIFVNGKYVSSDKSNAPVNFVAETNSIAVFVSHRGRNKAYNYLGSLSNFDRKGLWGKTFLQFGESKQEVKGWTMCGGVENDLAVVKDWNELKETENTPTFYRATFETMPPQEIGAHPILRVNYQGLSRGTMWINGHNLGRYPEKINIDSLYIPECWLKNGGNTLTVFDETGASPKQMALVVETAASREVIRASQAIDPETPIIIP
jgi:beta-galactosidase